MLLKVATFFLVGMAILGLFGKLRTPRIPLIKLAERCDACGAKTPPGGSCPCKKKS